MKQQVLPKGGLLDQPRGARAGSRLPDLTKRVPLGAGFLLPRRPPAVNVSDGVPNRRLPNQSE
jgi:hypothetical protein